MIRSNDCAPVRIGSVLLELRACDASPANYLLANGSRHFVLDMWRWMKMLCKIGATGWQQLQAGFCLLFCLLQLVVE